MLIEQFGALGCDVVEMVLQTKTAGTYQAAQWLTMRGWLDHNADDELVEQIRAELATEPARYARYTREYLGWGVFALMTQ